MRIRGIDFVSYPVSDLKKSIEWYENVLGLKLDHTFGDSYAEFDVEGYAFAIGVREDWTPGETKSAVAFNVSDIADAVAELKSKGVEPTTDVVETPVCRMAAFADPDGNTFLIHEKPKKE